MFCVAQFFVVTNAMVVFAIDHSPTDNIRHTPPPPHSGKNVFALRPGRREGSEGLRDRARHGDVQGVACGGCARLALLHTQPGEGEQSLPRSLETDWLMIRRKSDHVYSDGVAGWQQVGAGVFVRLV